MCISLEYQLSPARHSQHVAQAAAGHRGAAQQQPRRAAPQQGPSTAAEAGQQGEALDTQEEGGQRQGQQLEARAEGRENPRNNHGRVCRVLDAFLRDRRVAADLRREVRSVARHHKLFLMARLFQFHPQSNTLYNFQSRLPQCVQANTVWSTEQRAAE